MSSSYKYYTTCHIKIIKKQPELPTSKLFSSFARGFWSRKKNKKLFFKSFSTYTKWTEKKKTGGLHRKWGEELPVIGRCTDDMAHPFSEGTDDKKKQREYKHFFFFYDVWRWLARMSPAFSISPCATRNYRLLLSNSSTRTREKGIVIDRWPPSIKTHKKLRRTKDKKKTKNTQGIWMGYLLPFPMCVTPLYFPYPIHLFVFFLFADI